MKMKPMLCDETEAGFPGVSFAALAVGARLCAWQGSPTSQPRDRAFAFFRTAVKKSRDKQLYALRERVSPPLRQKLTGRRPHR